MGCIRFLHLNQVQPGRGMFRDGSAQGDLQLLVRPPRVGQVPSRNCEQFTGFLGKPRFTPVKDQDRRPAGSCKVRAHLQLTRLREGVCCCRGKVHGDTDGDPRAGRLVPRGGDEGCYRVCGNAGNCAGKDQEEKKEKYAVSRFHWYYGSGSSAFNIPERTKKGKKPDFIRR